jgi:hypothetical protein
MRMTPASDRRLGVSDDVLSRHFAANAALIALAMVLAGCSDTRPDPLAGAMRASDEDSAIVQAAALDFLEHGDCREGSHEDAIVVVDETLGSAYVFSRLRLEELPTDLWEGDLKSGLPNLRARNGQELPIDWHFADQVTIRDVVLRGEPSDAIHKAATLGKYVTTFALPGIYAEGRRATVVFNIAPEYHGRLYISSLRLVDGVWRVERGHNYEYL